MFQKVFVFSLIALVSLFSPVASGCGLLSLFLYCTTEESDLEASKLPAGLLMGLGLITDPVSTGVVAILMGWYLVTNKKNILNYSCK